jgi:PmbA protein
MSLNTEQLKAMDWQHHQQQMLNLSDRILEMVKQKGATSAKLSIGNSQGVSVEVRQQQVESLEFNRDKGLSLTVYKGQQKGTASTTDFSDQGLQQAISAALSIAEFTQPDPFSGLPEEAQFATDFKDLELYYPWQTSVTDLVDLATSIESAGINTDKRICNSEGGSVNTHESVKLIATSNGFRGFKKATNHSANCVLIAEDNDGLQRDYYYSSSRNPENLLSASEIGVTAAERTVAKLGAKQAKQGKFPVVFSPEIARGIMGHFLSGISGSQLYRKSSFLMDSLDEHIFPDWFWLNEQPHLLSGLASSTFDAEGVATMQKYILHQGCVKSYLLSCYSARKLNLNSTANSGGAFNLNCSYQDISQQQLLSGIKDGLLVTELMGQGVNLVTGDYSRGAGGFWIKDGKISHPVKEITIAGNLKQMFKGIQGISNDLDDRSSLLIGSMLIDEMTVAI